MRYPLLIKAAFGGGGRGQKVVRDPKKFAESFTGCSKEAELGFGDGSCFVEEYLENVLPDGLKRDLWRHVASEGTVIASSRSTEELARELQRTISPMVGRRSRS